MARKTITPDSKVYSAAAFWTQCDAFFGVVATTAKKAEREINKAIREAARQAWDDESYPTIKAAMGDLRWSGVHAWTLKDIVSGRHLTEAVNDLNDSGVYYVEV